MSKKIVEISLKSIWVKQNGEIEAKKAGSNELVITLHHPSPGRPKVTTITPLKLMDGEAKSIDFETVVDEETKKKKYDYFDRILFKEEIYDQTKLTVLLTHTDKPTPVEKFATGLLFNAIWGALTLPVENIFLSKTAGAIQGLYDDKKGEDIMVIGQQSEVIKAADLDSLTPGSLKEYTFKLKVPKTEKRGKIFHKPPNESQKPVREDWIVVEKSGENDDNGELVLQLKVI